MYSFLNTCSRWIFVLMWAILAQQASADITTIKDCLEKAPTPLAKMECFRGLPYRVDGVLDEHARWTTWENQGQEFSSAGLNCSGFTMAVSRSIWGQTLSLEAAKYDRLNDSGPAAPMGQDWDFGLDLILNLTDELPRRLIPDPYGNQSLDSSFWDASDLRGIDIDSTSLPEMLEQLHTE
ncbi:MAG: hypothetical protein ACRCWR_07340, partial [Saezia sp.]